MDNNNTTDNISHNPPSTSATLTTTTSAAATITTTTSNNNKDHFLRHLNKLSHKISKPTLPSSNFAGSSSSTFKKTQLEPPPLQPPVHPPQQQPPVYNINKSQFRDVVQKLTGSPAHPTGPPHPPSIQASKPTSSRLQRFRPPPLAQLNARPPPLINPSVNPLSPLPPLPTCHAAAESPISAYMRFLHNSVTSGHILQPQQAPTADATTAVPPFGYFPSPKSPCPLLSPNLVFSPTGNGSLGFPQLPVSPTVPGVPSPKWSDL